MLFKNLKNSEHKLLHIQKEQQIWHLESIEKELNTEHTRLLLCTNRKEHWIFSGLCAEAVTATVVIIVIKYTPKGNLSIIFCAHYINTGWFYKILTTMRQCICISISINPITILQIQHVAFNIRDRMIGWYNVYIPSLHFLFNFNHANRDHSIAGTCTNIDREKEKKNWEKN